LQNKCLDQTARKQRFYLKAVQACGLLMRLLTSNVGRIHQLSDLVIRKVEPDDCEVIASFIRMMLKEMSDMGGHPVNQNDSFWKSLRDIVLQAIQNSDRLFLIAENDERLVGFIEGRVGMLYEVFEPKKSFHISSIYVGPKKRNCGIAKSLIRAALRWASEKGCQEADLNILINNKNAKSLYESFGFAVFQHKMRMQLSTYQFR
jgi:GNAT superfamily N-acetyltransferase